MQTKYLDLTEYDIIQMVGRSYEYGKEISLRISPKKEVVVRLKQTVSGTKENVTRYVLLDGLISLIRQEFHEYTFISENERSVTLKELKRKKCYG